MLWGSGVSVTGISPWLVRDLYGKEVAAEVYPGRNIDNCQGADAEFVGQVEEILVRHIQERNYTQIKLVKEEMTEIYDWKTVTATRMAKCLAGLMARHGLKAIWSNMEIKRAFGIESKGYPRILVKEADLPELLRGEREGC